MQITPDDLLREAADMALELRMQGRVIAGLQAENEQLRGHPGADGHGHGHSHGEHAAPEAAPAGADSSSAPQDGGD